MARRADGLPHGAARPARRGDARRHRLGLHARQRAPRADLSPAADRRLPHALLRADARSRVRQRPLHQQHDVGPARPRASSLRRQLSRRRSWSLHLLRVVVFGSYKPPREITWLSGLALLGLVLALCADRIPPALGSARLLGDGRHDQHLAARADRRRRDGRACSRAARRSAR